MNQLPHRTEKGRTGMPKTRRQPRLMAHVQDTKRSPITIGNRQDEFGISRRPLAISSHNHTVARNRPNGSHWRPTPRI